MAGEVYFFTRYDMQLIFLTVLDEASAKRVKEAPTQQETDGKDREVRFNNHYFVVPPIT